MELKARGFQSIVSVIDDNSYNTEEALYAIVEIVMDLEVELYELETAIDSHNYKED